jgi:hypothetical protein
MFSIDWIGPDCSEWMMGLTWWIRRGCVGIAELSLTVPITNSLAFLFTVLGEWWTEGKVISRGKLYASILCVFFSFLLRWSGRQQNIYHLRETLRILIWLMIRYLDRNDIYAGWHCALCSFKDRMKEINEWSKLTW